MNVPKIRRDLARPRWWVPAAAALALAAGTLTVAASQPSYGAAAASARADMVRGHRLDHVFIIMLENHEADHVIGDPNTPFITSLASEVRAGHRLLRRHPPQRAQLHRRDQRRHLVEQRRQRLEPAGNQFPHANIVDELEAARIPWAAYMQAMPTAGYLPDSWPATGGALYASKHNPFILYNDIRSTPRARTTSSPTPDGRRPERPPPAALRMDQPRPVQRHARRDHTAIARIPRHALPVLRRRRRRQRRGAQGQGRRVRQVRRADDHVQPGVDRQQRHLPDR